MRDVVIDLEIAQEGCLDEKRLPGYAGFLVGWISGQLPSLVAGKQ
jgi:hypothetical protein